MKKETKEKVQQVLAIAAMVTPPWNIFWWTVGGIVYTVSGAAKSDVSGDGALGMVLAAPITLPMMPFMLLKERRELRKYEKRQALLAKAADWIAAELTKSGIRVESHGVGYECVAVKAEPTGPAQENEHAVVYALAVRRFVPEGLTIEHICGHADPLRTLDRTWAEANGFDAWAEEMRTGNCAECGVDSSMGWFFGSMITFIRERQQNTRNEVRFKDGSKKRYTSHVCQPCLDRLGWTSASEYLRSGT